MLMDIEAGRNDETTQNKKEKQPKPKKTNTQKRLIAGYITMYCFVAMAASSIPGLIAKNNYDKDIRELSDEQNAIYEEFMACDEFSDSFKAEFTKVSNDYANGLMSYEEFEEKIQYLNSYENARKVLDNSTSKLKIQVEDIDKQKQERADKYSSNIAVDLSLGCVIVGGAASFIASTSTMIYSLKESTEEKRKRKKDAHQGVSYYDSTTGKIRNTNGKEEDTYYDYTETLIPNPVKNNNEDSLTK
ncbi:MAG: hypothetical protein ACLRFE_01080 [Clostridia bacterium]